MTVRKAERLLNLIVLLLETPRPLTPREIHGTVPGYGQQEWHTFKRMFERDKEELREMGIPLELQPTDAWDLEEGYRIPKERYYLPDVDLSSEEAAALWLGAGMLRLRNPADARSALLKLGGDLPPADAAAPAWLVADLALTLPGLPTAFEAVAERKRLTFHYRGREQARPRTVEPYGLVHRRGAWYLVGRDDRSRQVRSFRLDRVAGELHFSEPSRPGPEFEPPEGFRPEAALVAPPFVAAEGTGTRAEVRFDASTAWWVERGEPWLKLRRLENGAAEAEVDVVDRSGFVRWVLAYGDGAEILGPPELRVEVRRRLEELCG